MTAVVDAAAAPPSIARPEPRVRPADPAALVHARLRDPDLPVAATLLVVLLVTTQAWHIATSVTLLAAAGLLVPDLRRRAWPWWALAGVLAAGIHMRWELADNHQYLLVYWLLAVGAATSSRDPARARARAARWLVAAVFLLATCWKLLSPSFVDGSFMELTLLTDERFAPIATSLADVDPADLEHNVTLGVEVVDLADGASVPLRGHGPGVARFADLLTWWTIGIEGAVTAAFLLPSTSRLGRRRDHLLLVFVATTYVAAPVVGFAWLLLVMGLAASERLDGRIPIAYAAVFVLVRLAATPLVPAAALLVP